MNRVFFVLLFAAGIARAEPSDAPEKQVKRLLNAAIEESKKNHDYGTDILITTLDGLEGRGGQVIGVIGPVRTDPTEFSLTAVIDSIEILSRSPQIQADCQALRPKLRAEMEAEDASLADTIRKGVTEALRQGLEARSAKDLEAPKAALESLLDDGRLHGEDKVAAVTSKAFWSTCTMRCRPSEALVCGNTSNSTLTVVM
jgi:hypothetical protein